MTQLIVSKFGGTSMGDAECMLRSAEVAFRQNSSMVVVSATSGTTNDLISLGKKAEKSTWSECEAIIGKIQDRHRKIASDLNADVNATKKLEALFEEMQSLAKGVHLLRDCSVKALDALMSPGGTHFFGSFCGGHGQSFKSTGLE